MTKIKKIGNLYSIKIYRFIFKTRTSLLGLDLDGFREGPQPHASDGLHTDAVDTVWHQLTDGSELVLLHLLLLPLRQRQSVVVRVIYDVAL